MAEFEIGAQTHQIKSKCLNPNATCFVPSSHIHNFLPPPTYYYNPSHYLHGFQLSPPLPSDPVDNQSHRTAVTAPVAAVEENVHFTNPKRGTRPRVWTKRVVKPISANNPRSTNSWKEMRRKRKVSRSQNHHYHSHVGDHNDQNNVNFTTIMIRNIPNKYTRQMLLDFLDNYCTEENRRAIAAGEDGDHEKSAIDFLYLPIDFRTELNKGYAFVNFTNARAALKFSDAMNDKKWDYFQSHKIRQIAKARLQGKEKLVAHFEKTGFPCESEEFLPICFDPPRDGSKELVSNQSTIGERIGRRLISTTTTTPTGRK